MKKRGTGLRQRREQLLVGYGNDAYRAGRKPRGVTRCGECAAVFYRGRWSWRPTPAQGATTRCPACRRMQEGQPAGIVRVSGAWASEHRDELVNRVRACEESERREHPLQRIMALEPGEGGFTVTTTDPHLARRIGDALRAAYKGELQCRYSRGEPLVRVSWSR